jgi:predicted 2-oxoglutarate/Fe(II)-dependent dioxygenase YbiX
MTTRLQVLFEEAELREVQKAARRERMTTAEWVRRAVRAAQRTKPLSDTGRKLDVIRVAARHAFPAPDMEQMLTEIERGYGGGEEA